MKKGEKETVLRTSFSQEKMKQGFRDNPNILHGRDIPSTESLPVDTVNLNHNGETERSELQDPGSPSSSVARGS